MSRNTHTPLRGRRAPEPEAAAAFIVRALPVRPSRSLCAAVVGSLLLVVTFASVRPANAAGHSAGGSSTYYVDPSGSNSNSGSISSPWKTVGYGITQVSAGDTLYLREGTYVERIQSPSISKGTSSSPITVAAYPGERPVIKGLFWITGPSYWIFDGLNVTWDAATGHPDEHMVKLINGVGWRFTNGEVWGAHSYAGILVASTVSGEPTSWLIDHNCIHDTYATNDTNQDQLIYANPNMAGPGVIERNLLFNATNGMGVKLGGPYDGSGGAASIEVRYNTIFNTSQSMLVSWGSHDNSIHDNLLNKVGTNYGNVRGYQLYGSGNVASDNVGGDAKQFILNDSGYTGVRDAGNMFPEGPDFDSTADCNGFHPQNADVQGYGRYAGEGGGGGSSIISLEGASAASSATTSLSIPRPVGVTSGDVMLAAVVVSGKPTLTAPSGWTLVRSDGGKGYLYWKAAGGSEPSSYVWTLSKNGSSAGGIAAYAGVSASSPILDSSGQINASSTSVTAPSITSVSGARVVGFFGLGKGTSVTSPSGMSELFDLNSGSGSKQVTLEASDMAWSGSGSTGSKVATAADAAGNLGQLVALRPA